MTSAVPYFQELEQLRTWHLARLRKQAVDEAAGATSRTPAGLMLADRETLEHMIEARVSAQLNPINNAAFEPPIWIVKNWQVMAIGIVMYGSCIASVLLSESMPALGPVFLALLAMGTSVLLVAAMISIKRLEKTKRTLLPVFETRGKVQRDKETEELVSRAVMQIAKLKERERLIADYSPNVSCSIDEHLNIKCATPASLRGWSYSFEELLKRPLRDVIYPADWNIATTTFANAKETMKECSVDLRIVRKDGPPADLRWSIEWSRTESTFFATTVDVSGEKQIERLKQEFVTLLSHDLRAPLNSVCLVLDLFRDGIFGEINNEGLKRLQMIKENIAMLQNIIGDLIDVHALEHERQIMQPELTNIRKLAADAVNLVSANAQYKKITLTNEVLDELPVRVDPVRIVRVLSNLLSNAVKFTPESGQIIVSARANGSRVALSVKDTGCGLSKEQLSKVFQPYWQASESNARQGSGLGLYGARMIVEAHGGNLEVESEVDKGSCFTINLPTSQAQ